LQARIKGSPHDLSALKGGGVCRFCHTPHGVLRKTPSWNHKLSDTVYKIYQSSSLEAKVGQPTGSSKLCLSCHDGTVALTHTVKGKGGGGVFVKPGDANLGTDLSDDHPISFVYSDTLSSEDSQIRPASSLPDIFKLDRSKELQCITCHDAHENTHGNFLVMSNEYSAMCITCHDLDGWTGSSHQSSDAPTISAKDSYLRDSKYSSVAENACLSCHRPHSAGGHERLLHFEKSEDNCLNCHDGSVASTNLRSDLSKFSKHNVVKYKEIHDLRESPFQATEHVECVDCHNPHSVETQASNAPDARGVMQNVPGITAQGSIVHDAQYEYEVCFKCHADNPDRIESSLTRALTQTNTRMEFDSTGPSFHPVTAPGINTDVPSLKLPLTVTSLIYCTDCHNSDSSSGTKGPHGSVHPYLLAYRYETSDFISEDETVYELCYQCHSRNSILNDESFSKHAKHLDERIPCSACHDAHGISAVQGTDTNNAHLINFDTNIVRANSLGTLEFVNGAETFRGSCSLECHGKDHDDENY
jgi:predicted CXXCH cytochrome family protein